MSRDPAPRPAASADRHPDDVYGRAARSRRRDVAKLHHPDLGGDAAAFVSAMRALDHERPQPPTEAAPPVVVHTTTLSRTARTVRVLSRRLVHDVRHHLPRSMPGSRRYGHL